MSNETGFYFMSPNPRPPGGTGHLLTLRYLLCPSPTLSSYHVFPGCAAWAGISNLCNLVVLANSSKPSVTPSSSSVFTSGRIAGCLFAVDRDPGSRLERMSVPNMRGKRYTRTRRSAGRHVHMMPTLTSIVDHHTMSHSSHVGLEPLAKCVMERRRSMETIVTLLTSPLVERGEYW